MLGPRRFLVTLGTVLLVSVGGAVPSTVAAARTAVAARPLPKAAARLVGVGPRGATYVLPDGRRMVIGPRTGSIVSREGATLLVSGTVAVHGKTFGFSLQAVSSKGGGPQDGVFFAGFGIGHGDFAHNRFGVQAHNYEDDSLGVPWVNIRRDLSRGWMSTGSALGPWGHVHLTLTADGPPIVRCHGRNIVQHADVTGRFAFTPQGDNGFFGTISSLRHVRASIRQVRGSGCGAGGGGGHGPRPCPSQPLLLDANRFQGDTFVDFFGSTLRSGRALVAVNSQQWIGNVAVFHELFGIIGSSAVHLGHKRHVTLRGIPRAFMGGEATFVPSGPAYHLGHRRKCGHGRSATPIGWDGRMSSATGAPLTGKFVTGWVHLPEAPKSYNAFLEHIRIEPR